MISSAGDEDGDGSVEDVSMQCSFHWMHVVKYDNTYHIIISGITVLTLMINLK